MWVGVIMFEKKKETIDKWNDIETETMCARVGYKREGKLREKI